MIIRQLATLTGLVISTTIAGAQGTFVYDQQSSTNELPPAQQIGVVIQDLSPFGQSFTPVYASVGFIKVRLIDNSPSNGFGATISLNLRSDSITGNILGSTIALDLPDSSLGSVSFLFPEPVAVVPGTKYFFDFTIVGDLWKADATEYNYPGGAAVMLGLERAASDLWFREGIVVPEPSSLICLSFGLVLACARRFRKLSTPRAAYPAPSDRPDCRRIIQCEKKSFLGIL